jgi:hypothetical protein
MLLYNNEVMQYLKDSCSSLFLFVDVYVFYPDYQRTYNGNQ